MLSGTGLHQNRYSSTVIEQVLKAAAARLITRSNRRSHITTVLRSLHWLPFSFRILTYRAVHGRAPSYLSELFHPYIQIQCSVMVSQPLTPNTSGVPNAWFKERNKLVLGWLHNLSNVVINVSGIHWNFFLHLSWVKVIHKHTHTHTLYILNISYI